MWPFASRSTGAGVTAGAFVDVVLVDFVPGALRSCGET